MQSLEFDLEMNFNMARGTSLNTNVSSDIG
jgi:hypothetical protein